jgi:hypothetical protein
MPHWIAFVRCCGGSPTNPTSGFAGGTGTVAKRLVLELATVDDTRCSTPPAPQRRKIFDNYEGLAAGRRSATAAARCSWSATTTTAVDSCRGCSRWHSSPIQL